MRVLDSDTTTTTGDRLTVVSVDDTATLGTVNLSQNGNISYAPAGSFESLAGGATAIDTFAYTIRNRAGEQDTATASITVTGANDAPRAVADEISVSENQDPLASPLNLLSNDTDVDLNDTRTIISVQSIWQNVTLVDGNVFYDPSASNGLNAGQSATDTFQYKIADGSGAQSTATVTVTIQGADEPVILVAEAAVFGYDFLTAAEYGRGTRLRDLSFFAGTRGQRLGTDFFLCLSLPPPPPLRAAFR